MSDTRTPALSVRDLQVAFELGTSTVEAVNGLSYDVHKGEMVAVVGESGSGKSVSALAILGLIESPPGFVRGGSVRLHGRELLGISQREYRQLRGDQLAIISQDALTSLSPGHTVGTQIADMFRYHRGMSRRDGLRKAVELLDRVRIPNAMSRVKDYPHQFSGGMRQRVLIAMGIALDPSILIADEPTTALDVTVQSEIMQLLAELQAEGGMGLVLITHDLAVVGDYADQLVVMYAGRAVERGPTVDLFRDPKHPYTEGLLGSIPSQAMPNQRLSGISGSPPILTELPPGCAFTPRCRLATELCENEFPPEEILSISRSTRCHHWSRLDLNHEH